ncbi:nuclear transport factor 2 family protein [Halogranum rubrum]|uniref:SnoaL-like domain-containing protein n=1 Tax=Halogranum salarium B-1 TaxID=1210908 RepID=J3JFZ2_9EURY|nr:nuclear transport factor 2 family protein [Halogranum salarium]EJN59664.1 hypothetical protein HSB1_18220 [Halogranum salarium B-1]
MASAQRQTNVETIRALYAAFNREDLEATLVKLADDVEWTEPDGSIFGGTHHGPDEVLTNVFEVCRREFDPFTVEPERFLDAGAAVVALGTFYATTRDGTRIESPFAHVWELADGKVAHMTNYTDTALWQ